MRYELIYGIGVNNCFTDLGGRDADGSHFILDMEFLKTRPNLYIGARYKIKDELALKVNLIYSRFSGSDALTNWDARANRGYDFSSNMYELSAQLEYSIVKERYSGRYTIKNIHSLRNLNINTYVFLGVGTFFNKPKTNFSVTDNPYAANPGKVPMLFHLAVPVGIGFKYGINRKMAFGIEFSERFTSTDYLDGHSDVYSTARDSYIYMNVAISYRLRTTRNGLPKF